MPIQVLYLLVACIHASTGRAVSCMCILCGGLLNADNVLTWLLKNQGSLLSLELSIFGHFTGT
jgi:hypothetical protein